jgi:hypothetical protein
MSVQAAAPRAYVSVNGNDANACSNPATPCRTYTGAIAQTTPGGEVIVLDSGTFGGGTISQAVTINAPAGIVALAATPIVVHPGAGNAVTLRGLTFKAPVIGTGTAITHQSGTLFVENVVIDGWNDGLGMAPAAERLFVKGSIFRNQANNGLWVNGGTGSVTIDDSHFERNGNTGAYLGGGTGRVSNSMMTANSVGAVITAAGGWATVFTFQRCEASNNSTAGWMVQQAGVFRVGESTVIQNGFGLFNSSSTLESFGNNLVRGNTTNTSGSITPVALQ